MSARNIFVIFMSGLLLMASAGVTLHKHYCMGRLQNVAVFNQSEACDGMSEEMSRMMGCCHDTAEVLKIDDLKKVSEQIKIMPDLKLVVDLSFIAVDFDLPSVSELPTDYLHYKPPLIERNIPVLFQSFII